MRIFDVIFSLDSRLVNMVLLIILFLVLDYVCIKITILRQPQIVVVKEREMSII